jgi:EAL domain-containing protein (putative c-di-GMP-specific phosphodiesterase class I)
MVNLKSTAGKPISESDPRAQLVRALQNDEFILFAQKIAPITPGISDLRCLEILLRLQVEEEQLLPPGGFFPAAEEFGMMGEVDRWVVRNLLKSCAARLRADANWLMPLYFVNISNAALCEPDFPRYVKSELDRCGVPGNSLCFEIGESDLIDHNRDVKAFMDGLKPLGCRFTAVGFGGVSVSFAPFKSLSFDFLKIDGIIIQNILSEQSDFAEARAIVLACRKVGVHTIAAFVESQDMLVKLREIGVDYVQGFGIGRPEPLEKLS